MVGCFRERWETRRKAFGNKGLTNFFGQPLVAEWSGSGRSDIATRNGAGFAGAMEGHGRQGKANIVKNFSVWYTFCRNMKN